MKIVRFEYNSYRYWGFTDSNNVIYTNLSLTADFSSFKDVVSCFDNEEVLSTFVTQIDMKEVKLLAPVMPTKNIMCIGKNY